MPNEIYILRVISFRIRSRHFLQPCFWQKKIDYNEYLQGKKLIFLREFSIHADMGTIS